MPSIDKGRLAPRDGISRGRATAERFSELKPRADPARGLCIVELEVKETSSMLSMESST